MAQSGRVYAEDSLDEKTKIITSAAPINEIDKARARFEAAFDSMWQKFLGTYDQLDAYLAKIQSE